MSFLDRLRSLPFFQLPSRSRFLDGLVDSGAALAIAFPLLGLLGGIWWGFDLLAHFRVQFIAALIAAAAYFLIVQKTRRVVIYLGIATGLSLPLLPYFLPKKLPNSDQPALTVISYNVNTANPHHAAVREWLLAQNADVIFLMEVNDEWLTDLQLTATYPHALECPREDNFGLAVYSKQPFGTQEELYLTPSDIPSVEFSIPFHGAILKFFGVHTLPPISAANSEDRNNQLAEVARRISEQPTTLQIAMGDFNLTPYSRIFARFLHQSGLNDTAPGFGLPLTWMTSAPLIAIPIDQFLISPGLSVRNRTIGPSLGSDHHPLRVEITTP